MESNNRISLDNNGSQQQELSNLRQYKDDLMAKLNDLKANRQSLLRTPSKLNEYIDCIDKIVECFDYRLNKTELAFLNKHKLGAKKQEKQTTNALNSDECTLSLADRCLLGSEIHLDMEYLIEKLNSFLFKNNIQKSYFLRKFFGINVTSSFYVQIFFLGKSQKWERMRQNTRERAKRIYNFLNSPNEMENFLNQAKLDQHRNTHVQNDQPEMIIPRKQLKDEIRSQHNGTPEHPVNIESTRSQIKIPKSTLNIPQHKEQVLVKYFLYNRYPNDEYYKTKNQFHANEYGFDYLSKLLDLDISLIKRWFDWKINRCPLYTFQKHYKNVFNFYLSNPTDHEVQVFSRNINKRYGCIEKWIHARHITCAELKNAIKFYEDNFANIKAKKDPKEWNIMDGECDAEDEHFINDDDIERIDDEANNTDSSETDMIFDE